MPIYEYRCTACGNEFEKLVSLQNTTPIPCPACHATDVRIKISKIAAGKSGCDGCTSPSCGSSCHGGKH